MITHKTFTAHLQRIYTKAILSKEIKDFSIALQTLKYAIQEIDIHSRNTITKTVALLRLENNIFREAYELMEKEAVVAWK